MAKHQGLVVVDAWERLPSTVKMYLNYIANEKEDITDKNVDKYLFDNNS